MTDECNRPNDNSVIEGLDFILNHFNHQICLWPRTISTRTTEGRQIIVNTRDEAIARFKQANYMDCRISAYPYCRRTITATSVNGLAPNFIMIDLDVCNFDNDDDALQRVLKQTVARIKNILQLGRNAKLTVIYSGNGYHIYVPIDEIVLDNACIRFIRFAEWYLSDGKSDHSHNTTVSPNNCMLLLQLQEYLTIMSKELILVLAMMLTISTIIGLKSSCKFHYQIIEGIVFGEY